MAEQQPSLQLVVRFSIAAGHHAAVHHHDRIFERVRSNGTSASIILANTRIITSSKDPRTFILIIRLVTNVNINNTINNTSHRRLRASMHKPILFFVSVIVVASSTSINSSSKPSLNYPCNQCPDPTTPMQGNQQHDTYQILNHDRIRTPEL